MIPIGGKPSKQTPADRRLKENRGMPPRVPAPMPAKPAMPKPAPMKKGGK